MVSYYDNQKDETIHVEDGSVIIYDSEGYTKSMIELKDDDMSRVVDIMKSSNRYEEFYNEPLRV